MSKEKITFVESILNEAEKSEKEILREKLEDFVEDAKIEINTQVSHLETGLIPRKENEIKNAKRAVEKAEKAFEKRSLFVLDNMNIESYVSNRNRLESNVVTAKEAVEKLEAELKELKAEVVKFKEIAKDFE